MKKRIALFANGWTSENLSLFITALKNSLPDNFADIFMFVSYESYGLPDEDRKSMSMVFRLPDLSSFDAAIVFYPGLNFADSIEYIYKAIDEANIPVINIANFRKGDINIATDNYVGMVDLCNHIIEEHNCQKIVYIAGSEDNEDSNERLRALKDTLASHEAPAPTVYYSNWESGNAKMFVQVHHCTDDALPDAFVCANDILAAFVILALEEKGYSVPEDTIVTGFDHTLRSQIFYPAISSVNQHFDNVGAKAAHRLVELFESPQELKSTTINCSFLASESCGCDSCSDAASARKIYSHNFPYRDEYEYMFSSRMYSMEESILQATDYKSLKNNLHWVFTRNDGIESGSFFMMIDPLIAGIGHNVEYTPHQFSDVMEVIVAKHNSKPLEIETCTTKLLVPELDKIPENFIHILVPFFIKDFMCGYFAFANNLELLNNYRLYEFINKVNQILIALKRNLTLNELNLRLSELMEQDTLTKVKNRAAYEKYLKNLEQEFNEGENAPFAVVYFDINNLKMVNDMYGHEKGDAYIKNSCRLMCNTFKHSPVFRIGGDEFVSIVLNDDYTNRHTLLAEMKEHMATLKQKGDSVPLTERISIATGMAEYDRTLDEDFTSIFKRADEIMYENKYKMKKDMN